MFYYCLGGFLTAYYFVNITGIVQTIKKFLKKKPTDRIKPLDCTVCLAVWLTVILWFLPIEVSQFLTVTFGAGFIATRIK